MNDSEKSDFVSFGWLSSAFASRSMLYDTLLQDETHLGANVGDELSEGSKMRVKGPVYRGNGSRNLAFPAEHSFLDFNFSQIALVAETASLSFKKWTRKPFRRPAWRLSRFL
jgi:hypothetical protein